MSRTNVATPTGHASEYLTAAERRELRAFHAEHGMLYACARWGVGHETMRAALGGGRIRRDTAARIRAGLRGGAP